MTIVSIVQPRIISRNDHVSIPQQSADVPTLVRKIIIYMLLLMTGHVPLSQRYANDVSTQMLIIMNLVLIRIMGHVRPVVIIRKMETKKM